MRGFVPRKFTGRRRSGRGRRYRRRAARLQCRTLPECRISLRRCMGHAFALVV